jgi:hypothetical protein
VLMKHNSRKPHWVSRVASLLASVLRLLWTRTQSRDFFISTSKIHLAFVLSLHLDHLCTDVYKFDAAPAVTDRSRQHLSRSTWGLVSRSIGSILSLVSRHQL